MQLEGKVALVTGGGRGIGRAIAVALAQAGADVCVTARSVDEIEAVAAEISALGRLDILVNNAGGGLERNHVGDDNPDNWSRVIEINLLGTYYCSRAALPHLKQSGAGKIINVGSGMGHHPRTGNSSYNTAKAGVWMLTRCLAMEVWQDNITVNELIPGPVYTKLTSDIFLPDKPHPAFETEWIKQPADVVPLALFLATQPATGPTGQTFSLTRRPI